MASRRRSAQLFLAMIISACTGGSGSGAGSEPGIETKTSLATTTAAPTTPSDDRADQLERALPYFEALYEFEFANARRLAADAALDFATFEEDRSLGRLPPILVYVSGVPGRPRVVNDVLEYCDHWTRECFEVSSVEFDDQQRLVSFSLEGVDIRDSLWGSWSTYSTEAFVCRPCEGFGFGPPVSATNPGPRDVRIDLSVRPLWIFEGPRQSLLLVEVRRYRPAITHDQFAGAGAFWGPVDTTAGPKSFVPMGLFTNSAQGRVWAPFAYAPSNLALTTDAGEWVSDRAVIEVGFPLAARSPYTFTIAAHGPDEPGVDFTVRKKSDLVEVANHTGIGGEDISIREAIESTLSSCSVPNPDQIIRTGNAGYACYLMYLQVAQFDVVTGNCAFIAGFRETSSTNWLDYPDLAWFGYGDDPLLFDLVTECPDLSDVDQDDFLKAWVLARGNFSYTTVLGGTATVPAFKLLLVDVVRKS